MPINIPQALDRLCYRYPSMLVDVITEYDAGRRLVAVKNVTVNEEFFQGHFPGTPLMPAVLMLEALSQVATVLLVQRGEAPPNTRVYLRGVTDAKFRKQVVPGDQLRLEVSLIRRRANVARTHAAAYLDDQVVAECEMFLGIVPDRTEIDATAIVHPSAQIGQGTVIGPHASIGAHVKIGANCRIGASSIVEGSTEIGDGTEIYPFASIGLIPQDLKFLWRVHAPPHRRAQHIPRVRHRAPRYAWWRGDPDWRSQRVHGVCPRRARLPRRQRHALREHGHARRPRDRRGFRQRQRRIGWSFISIARLRLRAVHRRLFGRHQGRAAVRPHRRRPSRAHDAWPNTIGLVRRRVPSDVITRLKRSFRYLLQSKLNTTSALRQIERDPSLACAEVEYLLDFIRTSERGVILRRAGRRADDVVPDE